MTERPPNIAIDDDPSDDVLAAFISYASPDRERAREIADALEQRGLRCWIAPRDVRPGHDYGAEIIHGIERSRCLVLVLSEAANKSTFVRREVVTAVNRQKPVFPIRVADVLPSPALELYVSSTHWIDAWSGALVDHVRKLAEDLADERLIAEGRDRSRRIARRRRVPRWVGAVAAFLAIAIAVVVVNKLTRTSSSASAPGGNGASAAPTDEALEDGPGGMYAAYRRRVRELGINFDKISKDDFTFEVTDQRRNRFVRPRLIVKARPQLLKILESFTGFTALDGGDPDDFPISMGQSFDDQADLAKARSLTLSFQSHWQATGEDRTIGPFTYDVNFEPAMRGIWKDRALADAKNWAKRSSYTSKPGWVFGSLADYLPGVRQVCAGTSPDRLNVQMEIKDPSGDYPDELERDELRKAYTRRHIPVPIDAPTLYLQVEFYDGTLSELRRYDLP
jgi:hypothetical protein